MRAASQVAAIALAVVLAPVGLAPVGLARAGTDLGTDAQRAEGKRLYDRYCVQCHGAEGRGDGIAAPRVLPRPRDFTTGKYKIRTTPSGALPTDEDIARAIREGLPYTSMPGWPQLSDAQVRSLVFHLKTYSEDFANPDKHAEPIGVPAPPESDEASVARGREVYEEMGCIQCHGELGRGDGPSAPTMTDDKGDPIRPADLTERWTFRGGPTPEDVFRTFTTGLSGTPMPAYADTIEPEDRWHLVNYIVSLGDEEPGYDELLIVRHTATEIDPDDPATLDEAFADAPVARVPLLGQIVQPGRAFHPPTTSVEVQAVHDRRTVAIRVRWHDRRADTTGTNAPDLDVPPFESAEPAADDAGGEDFWGAGETQDSGGGDEFWGVEEGAADSGGGDDFWGEEAGGDEDEFWGGGAPGGGSQWSDAVALQLPKVRPEGIVKPYFLFGDSRSAVDLWFVDLASGVPRLYTGRGSDALEAHVAEDLTVTTGYDRGEWTVTFVRPVDAAAGVPLEPGGYVPFAVTVWNGMNDERGNHRALSQWQHLYVQPAELASAVGPMIRVALIVLVAEIVAIVLIRRRYRRTRPGEPERGETLMPSPRELAG